LFTNLHVDYAWYEANQPGLRRLLAALKESQKPEALMLMSCNSANLFAKPIAGVAPGTAFVGTNAIVPGEIPSKTAIAGMDSFLRFQCQRGFNNELRLDPDMAQQIRPISFR
jgi:hypothetical protein